MPKSVSIIPAAPVVRILLKAGAKRVSAKSAQEFVSVLSSIADDIAIKAVSAAKHAKRKTVLKDDVLIAGSLH